MKHSIFVILISLLLGHAPQASAQSGLTILYSGTFDPFHRVHLQEVEGALAMFPGSKALVMPIQRAPHTPQVPQTGTYQPTFLSYEEIVDVARASVAHNPRIEMDFTFRFLVGENSGIAQAQATEAAPGQLKAHLVGTDIMKVWEQKEYVEAILKTGLIIVSADPSDTETYHQMKARYAGDPRVKFISVVTESIRSTDLRLRSLADHPREWIKYLARGAIEHLSGENPAMNRKGERYLKFMREFARDYFIYKIRPHLQQAGVSARLLQLMETNESVRIKALNYLYARIVAGQTGADVSDPAFNREVQFKQRTLAANPQLLAALIDGARTIKALKVLVAAYSCRQLIAK